ncbi:hypothetical protein R1flu_023264 [Riccia fluitans]|uniref:Elongation factor 1-gamma n=1 Tax=Riccia fluitans TaxID=41844 RepID=A0ABD1XRJ2_9MARC
MATYKIYGGKENKNALKALITAEYVGVKIEVLPFERGVTSKTPEFTKLNPIQKVPVLVTPEGGVFESNAIARHVARTKDMLLGSTLYEKAQVDQWCDFAATEIDANMARYVYPKLGMTWLATAPNVEEFALNGLKRALGALNSYLASQTYVVGNTITVADIVIACNLLLGVKTVIDKTIMSEFPHVERYFWTLVNQPEFLKVMGGEVSYGQAMKEIQAMQAAAAKQAAEAAKPKEAPAPAAAAPAPAGGDDEEEVVTKKPKNPLDLLPPSPMVMDNWKRLYSNTKAKDFAEVAIKGFWEMYDPKGYSLWFCDYKYNEENTVSYVTLNKVGGFLQRMDFIRKYGFGKMCILGENPPFKIKGVWLFRGTEIPQMVKDECYDMELYEWTKVDISDEAQKATVSAYFEEPDVINGEKLLEAKCFK